MFHCSLHTLERDAIRIHVAVSCNIGGVLLMDVMRHENDTEQRQIIF